MLAVAIRNFRKLWVLLVLSRITIQLTMVFKSIPWLYIDGKEICTYYSSFIIDIKDFSWNVFKTNSCYTKLHVRNRLVRTHTFQLVSNTNTYTYIFQGVELIQKSESSVASKLHAAVNVEKSCACAEPAIPGSWKQSLIKFWFWIAFEVVVCSLSLIMHGLIVTIPSFVSNSVLGDSKTFMFLWLLFTCS